MADSKSRDEPSAPYFPAPRKATEASPYRKAAPAPPVPVEPVKSPVIVSRPEPPAPLIARRKSASKRMPPPPPPVVPTDYREAQGRLAIAIFRRYPRLCGAVLFVLAGLSFRSDVIDDHRSLSRASELGTYFMHNEWAFQLNAGLMAAGLWLAIWGVPIDPKTGRPVELWILGLFIVVVIAVAARGPLASMLLLTA